MFHTYGRLVPLEVLGMGRQSLRALGGDFESKTGQAQEQDAKARRQIQLSEILSVREPSRDAVGTP